MWKLLRIGTPVSHIAKPSSINVEHVHAKFGGIANHAHGNLFVDLHAAAPTVIHNQGVAGILPSLRIAENRANPGSQDVPCTVGAIAKSAKENDGRLETLAGFQASAKRTGIGIEPQGYFQRILFPREGDASSSAKFDTGIPATMRGIVSLNQSPWNDFTRLVFEEISVGA